MKLSDEILVEKTYVEISTQRTKVMKCLEGKVLIPTEIARDSGIIRNHVSGTLKKLSEHGLVECINPEVKKGRLYRLTEKGEMVSKNITLE